MMTLASETPPAPGNQAGARSITTAPRALDSAFLGDRTLRLPSSAASVVIVIMIMPRHVSVLYETIRQRMHAWSP